MTGEYGGHVVLGDPAVAGARFDGFPHGLKRNAGFRTQHQTFADGGGADEPQQVGQQLDGGAVAGRADMEDFFAEDFEDGFVLVEAGFRAAHEDRQSAECGEIDGIGHRRFEKVHIARAGELRQLDHEVHRTGRGVDHRGAGTHRRQNSRFTEHGRAYLVGAWQRSDHHVGGGRAFSETGRPGGAVSDEVVCLAADKIEYGDGVARLDEVGSHGITHVADADETDAGFGAQCGLHLRESLM